MAVIDFYIVRNYLRVLLICFVSLTGLFVVIDLFANLDELLDLGRQLGGLGPVLLDYYGPRVLSFFDRTSSLLALAAAVFTVSNMQRSNELIALSAAGVAVRRTAAPLIACTLAVSLLAVANRETLLPQHREKLIRNAQNWRGDKARPMGLVYDYQTDIRLGGKHLLDAERAIDEPKFQLPDRLQSFGRHLLAARARYEPPRGDRPGGYRLSDVKTPRDLAERPSAQVDGRTVIYSPLDTPWLAAGECFVASQVEFEQIIGGSLWRRYASTAELMEDLRNPSLDFGADARVDLHARLVKPALDVALLLVGLAVILRRQAGNMFVAAGQCLGMVALFFVVTLTCHGLGAYSMLRPDLAAWGPLLVFGPLAAWSSQVLCE